MPLVVNIIVQIEASHFRFDTFSIAKIKLNFPRVILTFDSKHEKCTTKYTKIEVTNHPLSRRQFVIHGFISMP